MSSDDENNFFTWNEERTGEGEEEKIEKDDETQRKQEHINIRERKKGRKKEPSASTTYGLNG